MTMTSITIDEDLSQMASSLAISQGRDRDSRSQLPNPSPFTATNTGITVTSNAIPFGRPLHLHSTPGHSGLYALPLKGLAIADPATTPTITNTKHIGNADSRCNPQKQALMAHDDPSILWKRSHAREQHYHDDRVETEGFDHDDDSKTKAPVPGFPDFPLEWGGQAGGDRINCKTPSRRSIDLSFAITPHWKIHQRQRHRRLYRAPVNVVGIKASMQGTKIIRKRSNITKQGAVLFAHRRRILRKLKLKAQMNDLNRSLANLSGSAVYTCIHAYMDVELAAEEQIAIAVEKTVDSTTCDQRLFV
eukprot:CAMPEP_0198117156 /NCGR_PEP_ID=MMETSP1442-20131203/16709_1 /TAXON_ID= /ORGANISM="Craspedostauros australis, Strain CCMP3328" /LENGTH=303 /DNA_ID=CAMNT_0043775143 /DNA_START=103 /DNA_END=1015 /DNA_ORIENTATION=+